MKTMQDFKNIESMKRNHALKKAIDTQLLFKPLGQKLRECHQLISNQLEQNIKMCLN